jgi:ubiquinone/menaquinone biosynthesis C-methylase UbiE
MSSNTAFDFNSDAIARSYDDVLVPPLFQPWAKQLVDSEGPWEGLRVLDLATGTGVVAELLKDRVGPNGKTVAVDINPSMLTLAQARCAGNGANVTFIQSPAHPLDLADGSVDAVVCQQGFQFFPDRRRSASEILRVLSPGGRVAVSTWRPVWECEFFGAICQALTDMGEAELCAMMRRPFDFIDEDELTGHFLEAGFETVCVRRETKPFAPKKRVSDTVDIAYATPIGPSLLELPQHRQDRFRGKLADHLERFSDEDGFVSTRMAANVLTARKAQA